MRILALIPARGGSKGVPRKNIRPLCGKPMLAYTIEAALAARSVASRIVVSTDDLEIAAIARQYGAEVPFMRPADLSTDVAPTRGVVDHAIRFVETQDDAYLDWVLLLQPTTPLREARDIYAAAALAGGGDCDSVISVVQVYQHHPVLMKRIEAGLLTGFCMDEEEGVRRQDYPPAYMRNGAIYLVRRDVVINRGSIWGDRIRPYVMPRERSINVDDEIDLEVAERLMLRRIT